MYRPSHGKTGFVAILMAALLSGLQLGHSQTAAKPVTRGVVDNRSTPATATPPAKYYALVIGNNDYKYVSKLQTPVNDALAVAQVLRDKYGFSTKVLLNATRAQVMTTLVLYRTSLTDNSNVLIYYAGHGVLDNDVDEAYWLPVDADRDNNVNWISADDITRSVRGIPSKHVLVISDSCYSGAILTGTRDIGSLIRPQERALYLAKLLAARSRTWMASGSNEPVPDRGPNGSPNHSPFANAFLQGLSVMTDNQFAASDLFFSYIKRKVGGSSPQLPQYGAIRNSLDNMGDFVFSRGGTAIEIEDLPEPPPLTDIHGTTPQPPVGEVLSDAETERNAINDVLHQYELAYNTKNAAALWKIWPGAQIERRQPTESYFKSAQSIRTVLQMGPPEISADHTTATVRGRNHVSYTPKAGPTPPASEGDITFTLNRDSPGKWVIVNVDVRIN